VSPDEAQGVLADHGTLAAADADRVRGARHPALQGCYTEGETEAEARALIEDAIRLHVEDRLATGEPIYAEVGTSKVRVAL
jgi:predicted RNase H-like HicB family nuclease